LPNRPVVLVADDDPTVRALLQTALGRQGFDLLVATDGREAIELLAANVVDVVLLDVSMPGMNGIQALREIRADERWRTLPVILVTGSDEEGERVRGLEGGADDYLAKPFAITELAARVRARIRARTAMTKEVERGRERRRSLAAALEELSTDQSLLSLASDLAERLPDVLALDGAAILYFARDGVQSIASSGTLRLAFPQGRPVGDDLARDIPGRAQSGAWLDTHAPGGDPDEGAGDIAYVPFRLGPTPQPLGCLVYAANAGGIQGPLSQRLPDLIDATDYLVAVLRPAVERADTANASITRIQSLIANAEFDIHLQPIVRLQDDQLIAVEALTRFPSGMRPDVQFAEAATYGLGSLLQRATLAASIKAASELSPEVALSVNLSADVLEHEPMLPDIIAAADRQVIVELTEHERIDDYDAVRAAFVRLGPSVKLAIDDAGSGFASLRHIFALRPDYVKLDAEWVRRIDRDPVRRALVSGLVHFSKETGCQLIAEGIEKAGELKTIRELGIGLGQGYLLGKPALPDPPPSAPPPNAKPRPRRGQASA
jgi:EAL domain-containing protein (putative c-di-GMP-specific phosphodiesterase class I)/DNA-binding response OmpR family regulator